MLFKLPPLMQNDCNGEYADIPFLFTAANEMLTFLQLQEDSCNSSDKLGCKQLSPKLNKNMMNQVKTHLPEIFKVSILFHPEHKACWGQDHERTGRRVLT